MGKKKTQEQFEKEIKGLVGNEYTFLETYKGSMTKIKVRHNICNNEYYVSPKNFLKGNRCRKCVSKKQALKNTKPLSYINKKLKKVHGKEYSIISNYKNVNTKVLVRHNLCGNEYMVRPDSLLKGSKCKKCLHNRYKTEYTKTTEKFRKEVSDKTLGEYELVSEYKGVYEPVEIFGGVETFKKQINHDNIKKEYAINNGYDLLEISYKVNNYENVRKVIENKVINIVKQGTTNQN